MMLKITLFLCIWCNVMCLRSLRFKKQHLSETRRFLRSSSFLKARCALIGQLSSALWLAEYLKHVTEMLRPLPYLETHSVLMTWRRQQQYYSENKSYAFFLCLNIWAV